MYYAKIITVFSGPQDIPGEIQEKIVLYTFEAQQLQIFAQQNGSAV
jgi:hypothetical protein